MQDQLPAPPKLSFRQRAGTKIALGLLLIATVVCGAGGLVDIALGGGPEDSLGTLPGESKVPQRMVILALAGLVNAGSAVGMWSWKRWGVYGVVCTSLFAFLVNWRLGGVPVALPGLIATACVAVFAMSVWIEFD